MKLNSQKIHCQAFYIHYVVGSRFFYAFCRFSVMQKVRPDYGTLPSRICTNPIYEARRMIDLNRFSGSE